MLRQNRDERGLEKLEDALRPPSSARTATGAPMWYGDDETAWRQFQQSKYLK